MWVKIKVDCKGWVIISAYAPSHEEEDHERLIECVSSVNAKHQVLVRGDLHMKVSNFSSLGYKCGA